MSLSPAEVVDRWRVGVKIRTFALFRSFRSFRSLFVLREGVKLFFKKDAIWRESGKKASNGRLLLRGSVASWVHRICCFGCNWNWLVICYSVDFEGLRSEELGGGNVLFGPLVEF